MPFSKGQSGNPGGRPKAPWTFMGLYIEELNKTIEGKDKDGLPIKLKAKKALAKRVVQMAINGDIQAIRELANRIEGMPKQAMDMDMSGNVIIDIGDIIGLKDGRLKPERDSTVSTETEDSTTNPV